MAGKNTALLRRIKSEGANGRNMAMIKSSKDNRYTFDSVVTHDRAKFPCWALPDLASFRQHFGGEAHDKEALEAHDGARDETWTTLHKVMFTGARGCLNETLKLFDLHNGKLMIQLGLAIGAS